MLCNLDEKGIFPDAPFSENSYGLKRVFQDGKPLTELYKLFCATYVALLPYLKKKIEERHNYYMTQDVEGALGNVGII